MSGGTFSVGTRRIGGDASTFIVAEAGVNHNGDPALALALVDAAADAGADAVKFQTFRAEALVSRAAPKAGYQVETTGAGETQREMLSRLELTMDDFARVQERCRSRDIVFFSTPFDEESADGLERLRPPLFKVPSGEVTNLPFLRHLARKGRPLIVSTGMCTLDEVATAMAAIREAGGGPVALLQCVSAYPAPPEDMNLRAMDTLRARFGVPVGLSDHTLGVEVALAAVARGAAIVEKHLTLDKALPGPDHRASLDVSEMAALVRGIRTVESALGDGEKRPAASELDTRRIARKSLVATRSLRAGERLTAAVVAIKRPGTGIAPGDLERVLGRRLRHDVGADEVIPWSALDES